MPRLKFFAAPITQVVREAFGEEAVGWLQEKRSSEIRMAKKDSICKIGLRGSFIHEAENEKNSLK